MDEATAGQLKDLEQDARIKALEEKMHQFSEAFGDLLTRLDNESQMKSATNSEQYLIDEEIRKRLTALENKPNSRLMDLLNKWGL